MTTMLGAGFACPVPHPRRFLTDAHHRRLNIIARVYDDSYFKNACDPEDWGFLNHVPKDACKPYAQQMSALVIQAVKYTLGFRNAFNLSSFWKSEQRNTIYELLVFRAALKWLYLPNELRHELCMRGHLMDPMSDFFAHFYSHSQNVSAMQLDRTEVCLYNAILASDKDKVEVEMRTLVHHYCTDTYGHIYPLRWKDIHLLANVTRDIVRQHNGNRWLANIDLLDNLNPDTCLIIKTFYE